MKTLFVNACVREESRTLYLARRLLAKLGGEIEEVNIPEEKIAPLGRESLNRRDMLLSRGELDAEEFRYARQLAAADVIVIAAPFWDLSFPACLKSYIESVMVYGVTFEYSGTSPRSLCRANKLYYVTTSGGKFVPEFGYGYIKSLAEYFFGITDACCIYAENLDIEGADTAGILEKAAERFGI